VFRLRRLLSRLAGTAELTSSLLAAAAAAEGEATSGMFVPSSVTFRVRFLRRRNGQIAMVTDLTVSSAMVQQTQNGVKPTQGSDFKLRSPGYDLFWGKESVT
jgi:hypothetical protein